MRALLALAFVASLFAVRALASSDAPDRYPAMVRCEHVAEDSFARVQLTRYVVRENGVMVIGYRCT